MKSGKQAATKDRKCFTPLLDTHAPHMRVKISHTARGPGFAKDLGEGSYVWWACSFNFARGKCSWDLMHGNGNPCNTWAVNFTCGCDGKACSARVSPQSEIMGKGTCKGTVLDGVASSTRSGAQPAVGSCSHWNVEPLFQAGWRKVPCFTAVYGAWAGTRPAPILQIRICPSRLNSSPFLSCTGLFQMSHRMPVHTSTSRRRTQELQGNW